MEIHKPKPIHNWRDFLKEVGIIVLGVSIALAGEQAVEKWREHRQYLEARDAMRNEIEINSSNVRRRDEFTHCLNQRLDDVDAILGRAETGQQFDMPNWIGNVQSLRIRFAAEAEAGKSTLFSTEEQGLYGRFYSYLHSFDIEQDRERIAWGRLRILEGRPHLSPELINTLRVALADARAENDRIQFLKAWVVVLAGSLHLRDRTPELLVSTPKVWPQCLPMNTPKADGKRLSEQKPRLQKNSAY